MDIYHIWFNLKAGERDAAVCDALADYMAHLQDRALIADWRLMRRKLGLGPADLPEFHVMVEVRDLAQLDEAFGQVAARSEPVESFHHAVNARVRDVRFALYRDFPDPQRQYGAEKF